MHEFGQSRQPVVVRLDEVDRLELGLVIGVLGHEAVVPAHRGRHGFPEVDVHELTQLRDLSLTRLIASRLLGALVNLADVACGQ